MRLCTTARAAASCAVTAIALTTLSAPPAVADPRYGGDVVEIQTHADKCFDVAGISAEDRTPIIQYGCDDESHQRFRLRRMPDGSVAVQTFSGKCLDVEHGSRDDGARLVQFRCHAEHNQRFRFTPVSRGRFAIRTSAGKCLDVRDGSLGDGASIVAYRCHGNVNQSFYVVPVRPWSGM
ncbi:hypothetical protein GCM10009850_034450 [Nonomuraea monospora]|uniref:Ricin B lectin domain-containing protein n=1 Tax=Nonomuraea monospora TaxID=568818 RepID=A0ABN3CFP0_9ACTN